MLDALADEISADGSPRPVVFGVDLAVPGSAARLGRDAVHALGGIDIAINNAGTNLTGAQPVVADSAAARQVFEVNLWSPLALTAAVLPAMRAAGAGVVVNVTSTVQAVPLPLLGYYASSKAALAQATRSLRLELAGTAIRVLEVVPGATDTALRDIDELPWKTTPPRTFPPVAPGSTATAIVRALDRGTRRVVHPRYSLLPLEIPAIGSTGRHTGRPTGRHRRRIVRNISMSAGSKPVDRRQLIVDTARKMFATRPYDQVTTAQVAKDAGVAYGLIAHHFVNKRGLYLAVMNEIAEEIAAVRRHPRHRVRRRPINCAMSCAPTSPHRFVLRQFRRVPAWRTGRRCRTSGSCRDISVGWAHNEFCWRSVSSSPSRPPSAPPCTAGSDSWTR